LKGPLEYGVEMVSCGVIYIPSFMKIDAGIQAILWFSLRNMRGCNDGITDRRDFFNQATEMGLGAMTYRVAHKTIQYLI
jgi:hypothetical protein